MPWLKLTLHTDAVHAEMFSDALEASGAIAVTLEDAQFAPEQTCWEQTPVWERVRITGLFPEHTDIAAVLAEIRARAGLEHGPPYATDLLADEDWAQSWKAHYRPLAVGRRLWVVPSWCSPPNPEAVNISLDPGLAFGTGDHPTTALCLEWLSEQPLTGRSVLDYGCGSGILAIAALKLGAREAWAVDIDPQALDVTRGNAVRNEVGGGLHVLDPRALPAGWQADIVVANILAGTLMELAPELGARVRPGGRLVLCGLLVEQANGVRARYETSFGFTERRRQGWVLLAGQKTTEP